MNVLSSALMRYTNAGQESLSLRTGRHPKARTTGPFLATIECSEKRKCGQCMTTVRTYTTLCSSEACRTPRKRHVAGECEVRYEA